MRRARPTRPTAGRASPRRSPTRRSSPRSEARLSCGCSIPIAWPAVTGAGARHTVELALWALKADVQIRSLQDPETFRDLLYAVVTGERNNEDSRRKGLATQAGVRRAVARGEPVGPLPDGYRIVLSVEDGVLCRRHERDPGRSEVVALVFRLALRGRTCGQIAATLDRRGHLTKPTRQRDQPRPFDVGKVYEMLRHPAYAALSTYKGEVLAVARWPAYITVAERERILARMARPRGANTHRLHEPYLLARLGRCGHCGAPLRANSGSAHRDGSFRRRYVCAAHRNHRGRAQCAAGPLDAHAVEAMVVASLPELLGAGTPTPGPGAARLRLREAARSGDDAQLEQAIDGLIGGRDADPNVTARHAEGQARMRDWIAKESEGRTVESRANAPELNELLRSWFALVAIRADAATVTITATGQSGQPAAVAIDRAAWARHPPLGLCRTLRYGAWQRAEIIGALQAWAQAHERSPRPLEWKRAASEHPHAPAVVHCFGDWNRALRAAGLAEVLVRRHHWSEAEILAALRAWARAHGRSPHASEWAHAEPEHPGSVTVLARHGSWPKALAAAGLPAPGPRLRRNTAWPQDAVIAALQRWSEQQGRAPRVYEWLRAGEEHPGAATVRKRLGSWQAALGAAGLPSAPALKRRWSEREILAALRLWAAREGRAPRPTDWTAGTVDHPQCNTVRLRFGSWKAALVAAELPLP